MKRSILLMLLGLSTETALFFLPACNSGTHLEAIDARAELNQQRAALAILVRTDGGAVASLAEAIYCSAEGTLVRAGATSSDAGVPCLQ